MDRQAMVHRHVTRRGADGHLFGLIGRPVIYQVKRWDFVLR